MHTFYGKFVLDGAYKLKVKLHNDLIIPENILYFDHIHETRSLLNHNKMSLGKKTPQQSLLFKTNVH